MYCLFLQIFSHTSVSAKGKKSTVVLQSGTSATPVHRGILHNVNRPICTNCCKNRPNAITLLRSASRSIKAFSVLIDVGCFVFHGLQV